MPDTKAADKAAPKTMRVITTRYVYNELGKPPLPIGSEVDLPESEALSLEAAGHVRRPEAYAAPEAQIVGPQRDAAVREAPPPAAPPKVENAEGGDTPGKQPPK